MTRETNSAVHGTIAVWHNGKRLFLSEGLMDDGERLEGVMNGASVSKTIRSWESDAVEDDSVGTIWRITLEVLRFVAYVTTPG